MELFKSGLKTVLGAPQGGPQPSGAETVEKLLSRVTSSTLLDDRRDACRALKAMSKKFCVEVGAQGMDILINVMETDCNDTEIVGYVLDTLCNITSTESPESENPEEDVSPNMNEIGGQFTEIYIKRPENVTLILQLLEVYDFQIRWPAVKLLTNLLIHRQKDLQECVLVSPMGLSKLMDLLSDNREFIRNDALLLLLQLTKNHANIQKIIAFENAFDRLLDIISEEGFSDGGIVVEDCLLLLLNLLKNNTSNQTFFKEGSFIQRLGIFFNLQSDNNTNSDVDAGWSAQKVTNIHYMLQVLRTLVAPSNPLQVTSSCQKVMNGCGMLEQLCNILMASGVPADILTETINTVAEITRGNLGNQEYFASVMAPSSPPRPAIVVLLMSMVNEKQPFVLRCAVLYCFQCFLYKNELGQAQIIQTLLPTSADLTTITAGQLLCGGLFSGDALSNWFASIALAHSLVDNPTQREQLLRVQLATSIGNPPVSLMNQCSVILQQGGKVQTRTGLLILISMWISSCSVAVSHFLSIPTNVPFLTSQVGHGEGDENEDIVQGICAFVLGLCILTNDDSVPSFTKDSLIQLIDKRIGLETFLNKLGMISKSEYYTRSLHKPEPKGLQTTGVMFDYEFCRMFRSLEGDVIKAVQPKPKNSLMNGPESNLSEDQHQLLTQYKDVIRDQDQQLSSIKAKFSDINLEHSKCKSKMEEMSSTIQQLRDQNSLLKAQNANQPEKSLPAEEKDSNSTSDLRQQITNLQMEVSSLTQQLQQAQAHNPPVLKMFGNEGTDELNAELKDKSCLIDKLKDEIEDLNNKILSQNEEISKITAQLSSQVKSSDDGKLTEENKDLQEQLETLQREQEDLLVLLSEQDSKISSYRKQLRELGAKIEDDDDDYDEEDEDEENFEEDGELLN